MARSLFRALVLSLAGFLACDSERASGPGDLGPVEARFGRPDFVVPPGGSIEDAVDTAGAGAAIHRTIVEGNTVTGNAFVGIGVASTLVLRAVAGLPPEAFARRARGRPLTGRSHARRTLQAPVEPVPPAPPVPPRHGRAR